MASEPGQPTGPALRKVVVALVARMDMAVAMNETKTIVLANYATFQWPALLRARLRIF